jgi:hypothetical protein
MVVEGMAVGAGDSMADFLVVPALLRRADLRVRVVMAAVIEPVMGAERMRHGMGCRDGL